MSFLYEKVWQKQGGREETPKELREREKHKIKNYETMKKEVHSSEW